MQADLFHANLLNSAAETCTTECKHCREERSFIHIYTCLYCRIPAVMSQDECHGQQERRYFQTTSSLGCKSEKTNGGRSGRHHYCVCADRSGRAMQCTRDSLLCANLLLSVLQTSTKSGLKKSNQERYLSPSRQELCNLCLMQLPYCCCLVEA